MFSPHDFFQNVQVAIETAQRLREAERTALLQREADIAAQRERDIEITRAMQQRRAAEQQATGSAADPTAKPDMRLRIFVTQPDGRTDVGTLLEDDPVTPGRTLGYPMS